MNCFRVVENNKCQDQDVEYEVMEVLMEQDLVTDLKSLHPCSVRGHLAGPAWMAGSVSVLTCCIVFLGTDVLQANISHPYNYNEQLELSFSQFYFYLLTISRPLINHYRLYNYTIYNVYKVYYIQVLKHTIKK